jgi:hypothetical protein
VAREVGLALGANLWNFPLNERGYFEKEEIIKKVIHSSETVFFFLGGVIKCDII